MHSAHGHEVIHFCDKHRHAKPRTTLKEASAHFYEVAGGAIDGSSTEARQFSFFAVGLVRAALAAHNKLNRYTPAQPDNLGKPLFRLEMAPKRMHEGIQFCRLPPIMSMPLRDDGPG